MWLSANIGKCNRCAKWNSGSFINAMTNEQRPDPDELLARMQAEEARQKQGKLKVFFGAAAGVGKTYAMLEAAHERKAADVDVVVGWIDTHGRAETASLLQELE